MSTTYFHTQQTYFYKRHTQHTQHTQHSTQSLHSSGQIGIFGNWAAFHKHLNRRRYARKFDDPRIRTSISHIARPPRAEGRSLLHAAIRAAFERAVFDHGMHADTLLNKMAPGVGDEYRRRQAVAKKEPLYAQEVQYRGRRASRSFFFDCSGATTTTGRCRSRTPHETGFFYAGFGF